jgi:hypothetical protein
MNISQTVEFLKDRFTDSVPATLIRDLCKAIGHVWRDRDLNPVVTTHLFLQQILHGNTAASHLRHLSGLSFTDSAYCQARQRLPQALLDRLQRTVTGQLRIEAEADRSTLWHGHRVFLIDGSSFSMPDTPALQKEFGQPSQQLPGCGFPVAHLMVLCDAAEGYLLQTEASPLCTHDLSRAPAMHQALRAGDVLVGDRGFASYGHFARCLLRGIHGLFRAHQKQIINFRSYRRHQNRQDDSTDAKGRPTSRWLKRLGKHDQLVEYVKPKKCPTWMTAAEYARLPETLVVREVRLRVGRAGQRTRVITLVTTLLDPLRYTATELGRLYGLRWQVETNLKHLKQTMKMDVLHSKSVAGVRKELTLFVLVYNLVRRVMREAGQRQQVPTERISFVDAWRWLQQAQPGDELPKLIVNPLRPDRHEPRVRKRRPKHFPVMKLPRAQLRKKLPQKRVAA